jgi:hypothetical protein
MHRLLRLSALLSIPVFPILLAGGARAAAPVWSGYAGNAQHTALSTVGSQPLSGIIWHTPVDLAPQYSGNDLLIHYGSTMVSGSNTVLVPVKTAAFGSFRVEARAAADGTLMWQLGTDYILPSSYWTPVFGPTLTPSNRLVMPAAGGTLLVAGGADGTALPTATRVAFYGIAAFNANPSAFTSDVKVCTPVTSDASGNVYFGFRATGANPLGLTSGIARVAPDGSGIYVSAFAATSGAASDMALNCAPAISRDGQHVYIAMSGAQSYLVSLNTSNLSTQAMVALIDPVSGMGAYTYDQSSAAPMVAPDDRIYYGVFENPYISDRGWMLQFDANLTPSGVPGGFGWDDTPSIVPTSMVPSYTGTAPYLLMTKYNYYAGSGPGGDGVNKIAILDPNSGHFDFNVGAVVMDEVLTITGVTPDSSQFPAYPNAVREWCINSAVVDPATHSVLANSEDGKLYRWDLNTNAFTGVVTLTAGVGEAYTPTMIAGDGRVYAINNATLFAVGAPAVTAATPTEVSTRFAAPWPNPSGGATHFEFSLAQPQSVRLEVVDVAGRLISRLIDETLSAGAHQASWNGRASSGQPARAGIYFARLSAGTQAFTQRFALTR